MPAAETAPAVRRLGDLSEAERHRRLRRSSDAILSARTRDYARQVLEDVAREGDRAVIAYTWRWDGVRLPADGPRVPPARLAEALDGIEAGLRAALEAAIARARRYNEWLRPSPSALVELEPGVAVGVRFSPLRSAGLYVPSGKGTFPSTLVTMGTPATVAGVERVAVVVPPRGSGEVDPAVLAAAHLLGITEVYACNGAAGIAALAVGTAAMPRVDALAGPGNPVIAAVQLAAAAWGARPLALLGPTESIVLADDTADPERLALDLLTEAEHGTDSAVLLLCTDAVVAERTAAHLAAGLARLPEPRRTYARAALTDLGGLFIIDDLDEGLAWINRYAPEHLQLAVRDPLAVAVRVRHAGEVLLGQHTPFAAANYAVGVPAALPTSGAGFAASGITVLSFLKATSVAMLTEAGLDALAPVAARLGTHEEFPAHVLAVTGRRKGTP
ncbi:MAG: histidinol dehydrogenase [Armatimonadota bacterium]|nr:histidinol dehydrogenase [Armatimonadota bacterium]